MPAGQGGRSGSRKTLCLVSAPMFRKRLPGQGSICAKQNPGSGGRRDLWLEIRRRIGLCIQLNLHTAKHPLKPGTFRFVKKNNDITKMNIIFNFSFKKKNLK